MAVSVNSIYALFTALRMVMDRGFSSRAGRKVFGGAHVSSIVEDFLKVNIYNNMPLYTSTWIFYSPLLQEAVLDSDKLIRMAASEAMGRLCSLSSTTFLGTQINNLVKEIVNNRDLNARAGCASTFGSIFMHAGRLAGQPYLKMVLNVLMSLIVGSGKREHLDLRFAKQHGIPTKGLIANRIPDLIKMALTSSAAYVTEICLAGLLVLKDVVEVIFSAPILSQALIGLQTFSFSPDLEYDDTLLLEQHQVPITAALTPAFSSDSTPGLLAFAVQVCAIFIDRVSSKMGCILKLLTEALDQSKSKSNSYIISILPHDH
jgi:hypothetical protein